MLFMGGCGCSWEILIVVEQDVLPGTFFLITEELEEWGKNSGRGKKKREGKLRPIIIPNNPNVSIPPFKMKKFQ